MFNIFRKKRNLHDQIVYGDNAKRILEDETFIDALSEVATDISMQWQQENCSEKREQLWMEQKCLTSIVNKLGAAIDNAAIARENQN